VHTSARNTETEDEYIAHMGLPVDSSYTNFDGHVMPNDIKCQNLSEQNLDTGLRVS